MLCDLGKLRNIIVHRVGTKGRATKHRDIAEKLAATYKDDLKFPKRDEDWWKGTEVHISMELCQRFLEAVEIFLEKVLAAVDALPASDED